MEGVWCVLRVVLHKLHHISEFIGSVIIFIIIDNPVGIVIGTCWTTGFRFSTEEFFRQFHMIPYDL
jgi:hypothetical protein